MKEISKKELDALIEPGVIRNTRYGYVNKTGETIGYYRTRNGKRYVENSYVK